MSSARAQAGVAGVGGALEGRGGEAARTNLLYAGAKHGAEQRHDPGLFARARGAVEQQVRHVPARCKAGQLQSLLLAIIHLIQRQRSVLVYPQHFCR